MSEIERQTSYRFVPNIEIDIEYPVSVYAENEPLKTVLDRLFAATPYTYSFLNSTTTILLSKRPQEQPAAVSGLVVDAGGRPVVGASVLVRGHDDRHLDGLRGPFQPQRTVALDVPSYDQLSGLCFSEPRNRHPHGVPRGTQKRLPRR